MSAEFFCKGLVREIIDNTETLKDTRRHSSTTILVFEGDTPMGLDAKKVRAVQLNLEGLFKLLGGSEDDRQKFWEKKKGITSVLQVKFINAQLDIMAAQAKALQASTKALNETAQEVARRG